MLFSGGILSVDYRTEGCALFCQRRNSAERIVAWGPDAGAWRRTVGQDWAPYCPEIDVNFMEQTAATSLSAPRRRPRYKNRIVACQFLLNAWPLHARELVRRFLTAHWQLLMFLNDGGDAASDLLQTNPALGFLVATGTFANRGSGNASLPTMLSQKRRYLAAQFGFVASQASVKTLQKIPPASMSHSLLNALREALKDHRCERGLAQLSRITPALLKVITRPELLGRFTPDSLGQLERIGADVPHFDIVARLDNLVDEARRRSVAVPMIRSLNDIDTAFRAPPPPPRKSLPEPKGRFPDPPLPETETITAIRSRRDLKREGDEMRHCIGTNSYYARDILRGKIYAYRVLQPERLTLAVRKVAGGWRIGEVKGFENALPGRSAILLIENWLRGQPDPNLSPALKRNPRSASTGGRPIQLSLDF